jgi:hypothetical protein
MEIWVEFRSHLLPWLVAAGVLGLMNVQENNRTQQFQSALVRQAQAIESQNNLLATQGYLVPPTVETQRSTSGVFESR